MRLFVALIVCTLIFIIKEIMTTTGANIVDGACIGMAATWISELIVKPREG